MSKCAPTILYCTVLYATRVYLSVHVCEFVHVYLYEFVQLCVYTYQARLPLQELVLALSFLWPSHEHKPTSDSNKLLRPQINHTSRNGGEATIRNIPWLGSGS